MNKNKNLYDIYIYIERQRERERNSFKAQVYTMDLTAQAGAEGLLLRLSGGHLSEVPGLGAAELFVDTLKSMCMCLYIYICVYTYMQKWKQIGICACT